ncbi:MAG: ABC transporter permease [Gemmatimonadales bacterium]
MHRFIQDLRYAARGLIRTPLFSLGVIVTLGLGIGVNATMFGVVDTLFLRAPAGVTNAHDVVRVYIRQTFPAMGTFTQPNTGYPAYTDLRDHVAGFANSAAMWTTSTGLGRGPTATQVNATLVSHQFFPLLGVQPALGRFFTADEDRVGGDAVAVLTYGFWQRRFGGDPAIIGRTLQLGKGYYTVIGVGPKGFAGINIQGADLFLPIAQAAGDMMGKDAVDPVRGRGWSWLQIVARLVPDAPRPTIASAATLAFRTGNSIAPRHRDSTSQVLFGPIQEARGPVTSADAKVSAWIGGVALIVLLIACANIANLLLARGVSRQRELAVRASLGAGRGGLIRTLLVESTLLAAVGGVVALVFVAWGGALAWAFLLPDLPRDAAVVDARVLVVAAVAVIATALLIGLIPAIQATRTDLVSALKFGGHGSTGRAGLTRRVLLVAQIALTLALLVGAGLFVRSLRHAEGVDLGLDADRIVTIGIDFANAGVPRADANATYLRLLDRVQRLPGVERAAASMGTPFGWSYATDLRVEGRDSLPTFKTGGPYFQAVTPEYFATMGTRVLAGRGFTASDVQGSGGVAVVGATFARIIWPGQPAIGKCLYVSRSAGDSTAPCRRVVGVAADAKRDRIDESETLLYYAPLAQWDSAEINELFVRARRDPTAIIPPLRREMQAVTDLPYATVAPLTDAIAPQLRSWRLGAAAFTAFGLLALLIAATGIFAVLSYTVSRRTREIGVRVALGAQRADVLRLVVVEALQNAAVGVTAGLLGAVALGRAMAALLFNEPAIDPTVLVAVVATLLAVAIAAAYLPARRAAGIAPMTALRSE